MAIALRGNAYVKSGLHCALILTLSRAYRPQRGRGRVAPIVSCILLYIAKFKPDSALRKGITWDKIIVFYIINFIKFITYFSMS